MTTRELYVGTITGVSGNILYAVIVGFVENANGFCGYLNVQIPLWYFLVMIFVACTIVLIMIRIKKKRLPFLKHTEESYSGFEFQWVWKFNQETGRYEMDDFWPICPECGLQLRVELYDTERAYHCTKGHCYDLNKLLNIKRDLVHKLQRDYKEYVGIIDFPNY